MKPEIRINHIKDIVEKMHERVQKELQDRIIYGESLTRVTWDNDLKYEKIPPEEITFPPVKWVDESFLADPSQAVIDRMRKQMAEEAEKRLLQGSNAWTFPLPEGWTVDPGIVGIAEMKCPAVCDHEPINVGFWHTKMVCKKCDEDLDG